MRKAMIEVGLLLTRVSVGAYFLLAAVPKVRGEITDLPSSLGTFYRGDSFSKMQPEWLPDWFAAPFAYALPWTELALGAFLVVGLLTPLAASLCFLMLVSFLISLVSLTGSVTAVSGDTPHPFNANYVYAAATFLLIFTGAGRISVDRIAFGANRTKLKD